MRKIALLLLLFALSPIAYAQTGNVDILYEGRTYTPPFYKGLSLWTRESSVTFLAVPQIKGVNPKNLFYKWSKDGSVLGNTNGIGKDTLVLTDSILGKPIDVEVEVLSSDNDSLGSASLRLRPLNPQLVVYELNPLYGYIFNQAVSGDYKLSGQEISFASFPFFFNTQDRFDSNLLYSWLTNTENKDEHNIVTYRAPEGSSGNSEIRASVSHSKFITEEANKTFQVEFSENDNNL